VNKKDIFNDRIPDKRIIEEKVRRGEISEADLKKYLDKLADVSDNAEEYIIQTEE
jgi:hypothetical protein